jgi:transcriptional regulator with XRE-family HTH domain
MDMIGRIRRLHSRKNKSAREISRITGLSRNTVAKWLHGEVDGPPKYRRVEQPNKLTAFHEPLEQALKADARRPKHERRTAKALYAQIKAAGYDGGYTRVTDFIRAWRQGEGQGAVVNAFVPLAFELGEAYQFDWSEEGLVVGGIYYRVQVSHMKLCASRAFWLVAYPSQGHEMLFDAHTRSFAALGGVARRGIYDWHVDRGRQGQEGQGPHRQRALRHDVRALPGRPRLLQRGKRLGEGRGREERAGQPPAYLDRRGQSQVRQLHRAQRLAGAALPGTVGTGSPPRT